MGADIPSDRIGSTAATSGGWLRRRRSWPRWFRYGGMKEAPRFGTMLLCVLNGPQLGCGGSDRTWELRAVA